jgi:hypothetical protein
VIGEVSCRLSSRRANAEPLSTRVHSIAAPSSGVPIASAQLRLLIQNESSHHVRSAAKSGLSSTPPCVIRRIGGVLQPADSRLLKSRPSCKSVLRSWCAQGLRSNQIAGRRIRRLESDMPSQPVRSPRRKHGVRSKPRGYRRLGPLAARPLFSCAETRKRRAFVGVISTPMTSPDATRSS